MKNNSVSSIINGKVRCVGYKRDEKFFTLGKVYEVKDKAITSDKGFCYKPSFAIQTPLEWLGYWYEFEPVTNDDKIVITHDGKVTTATRYGVMGNKVTATARCAPEDTFDFNAGAKLAMERLMEKVAPTVEPNEPKYYNGKVVCVSKGYEKSIPLPDFTVGKIYDVVNGTITDDVGWKSEDHTTVEHICISMGWTFIPLVE